MTDERRRPGQPPCTSSGTAHGQLPGDPPITPPRFSAAIRNTNSRIVGRVGGRPGWVRL